MCKTHIPVSSICKIRQIAHSPVVQCLEGTAKLWFIDRWVIERSVDNFQIKFSLLYFELIEFVHSSTFSEIWFCCSLQKTGMSSRKIFLELSVQPHQVLLPCLHSVHLRQLCSSFANFVSSARKSKNWLMYSLTFCSFRTTG